MKGKRPSQPSYIVPKVVIWLEGALLFSAFVLCIVAVYEAAVALRDFLDECPDPYFANEGLIAVDNQVTVEKKRAMAMLHQGIEKLASVVPDAAPVVSTFGWLIEFEANNQLTTIQLYGLQALMPVATMVERLTIDALRTLRAYMEGLCVGALTVAFLALSTVCVHGAFTALWPEYFNAVLGVNRTVTGAGVSIPAKRIVKFLLKAFTTSSCLLTLSMVIIAHYVIPTIASISFLFSCEPSRNLERVAIPALCLTLLAQTLVFIENATWRYKRIEWIKTNCDDPMRA